MTQVPPLAGPTQSVGPRRPGSARRTSNLDLHPQADGRLVLAGRARDALTHDDGTTTVAGAALLRLVVDTERRVERIQAHPSGGALQQLVGRRVTSGFRTAVWRALPDGYDAGSPVHLLLDDVPGGLVISGFTRRRVARAVGGDDDPRPANAPVTRALDVCVGWATDSDAARRTAVTGHSPPPDWTPPAPELAAADPVGWHTMTSLATHGMRRARRLDAWWEDGALAADVGFRDTFADLDGTERVLHEYSARVLVVDDVVEHIEATAHVLPHHECPLGARSARRVLGRPVTALRDWVSMELFGPTTCTHLNDLLRGLTDLPALAALAGPARASGDTGVQ